MRRLLNAAASLVALVVVAVITVTAVRNWMRAEPDGPTTADGRPLVTTTQPRLPVQPATPGMRGYDVSYPQCGSTLPSGSGGFGIVGLNRGKPFTANPCFATQWRWAQRREVAAIYINMADPGRGGAWDYGDAIGRDALDRIAEAGLPPNVTVWLDVETLNTWTNSTRSVKVINATLARLAGAGHPVGVYAAPAHWFEITLNAEIAVPVWLALGRYEREPTGRAAARAACREVAFGQQLPTLVQYVAARRSALVDHNVRCGS